jgi:hypothetical protein
MRRRKRKAFEPRRFFRRERTGSAHRERCVAFIPNPAIGTADYADDTDGQALDGDCDLTGSVSNGGENGGYKFLNP